ncbi:MAG: WYL domain-containing protein [Oscillospiraceae bacterium]|nr:WYL domain-containing protein [Oscillospiraceae bacterium]
MINAYTPEKPLYILPHSLETDKLSMYNYLIGYARPTASFPGTVDSEHFTLESFRLSKIQRAEIDRQQKAGSGKLNPEQLRKIKESRAKHGTMFIADEDKIHEIVVRFTDEGKRKYINQVHMRPSRYIDSERNGKVNSDIYVFRCTTHQAMAYFFKFGSDAEILSPSFLREQFKQEYAKAARIYD